MSRQECNALGLRRPFEIAVERGERQAGSLRQFHLSCIVNGKRVFGGQREHSAPRGGRVRRLDLNRKRCEIGGKSQHPIQINSVSTDCHHEAVHYFDGASARAPIRLAPSATDPSKASVQGVASSAKHHGSVTEASATKPGISICGLR